MAVTINGTTGVAVPLGSAAAPAETNTTSNTTGIYYPTSTTLGLSTNGTNAMYIDASQNVGIGTSSPGARLQVTDGSFNQLYLLSSTTVSGIRFGNTAYTNGYIYYDNGANLTFQTNGAERMRIDPSGNLLVGTTSANGKMSVTGTNVAIYATQSTAVGYTTVFNALNNSGTYYLAAYQANGTTVGSITSNGTTTAYNVSSDYRLKENVLPMTTGLATVSALKPVTYKWNADNSDGEGFIAHELQTVIPHAVTGEKDAIGEDGNPIHQGVDYSKIVVHLVAAIQELSAEVEALKAKVGA
jgi:hypothetical protein